MEIVKKCEWCHKTFIGQMVTARFCSSKCCNQAYRYKRNVQSGKCTPPDSTIDLSTLSRRVDEKKHFNDTLKDKQFLSPLEAAELLGVCRSTIYNYLGLQELKAKQFRGKTIIRRCDIEKLFDEAPSYKKRGNILKGKKTHNDYYSLKEMMEKFKISKRTVFRRCEQFGIPQIIEGRRTFWKKKDVDVHFAELLVQYDLKDWYNAKQIEDIYGMKRAALNKYALRHNVPRIQFQNVTYFSKSHIDNLKRLAKIPDGNYYTVQDIVKSSSFSTSQVRYYVKNEELKVKRVNGLLLILRTDWDAFVKRYQASHLSEAPKPQEPNPFYTIDEIIEKYKVKETTIYRIAKAQNLDVFTIGDKKCFPKTGIDNYFIKDNPTPELTEWYSSEEIQSKYNMTYKQVTTFVCKHHIPRKYVGTKPYYSKLHVDKEKNILQPEDDFKTVEELMNMYQITVHQVREVIRFYHVPKKRCGKFIKLSLHDFNRIIEERKQGIVPAKCDELPTDPS